MTSAERDLLQQTALAVGAIGRALKNGDGIHDLEILYEDIMRNVAAAYERAYPRSPLQSTAPQEK